MKPLRLEITGFGPYLDTQVVDFERLGEHGLFLIHGRTGSGKSSILDALSFALYGETTGGERDGQDMITTSDASGTRGTAARTETKVVLDFEHQGKRYRVTRRPAQVVAKVRGEGTTNRPADASLEDLGTGEVIATKVRDVTVAVREMLRCDVDQFRQTVVLPQGDFRRVVTDDTSRRAILTRIFRTEKFERLAERLKEHAKGLANQGRAVRERRERLLADLGAANSAAVDALLASAEADARAADERRTKAVAAKMAAVEAKAVGHALESDFKSLATLRAAASDLASKDEEMSLVGAVVERAGKAASLAGSRDDLDRRTTEHDNLVEEVSTAEVTQKAARTALESAKADLERLESLERPQLQAAEQRYHQLEGQKENVAGLAGLRASLEEAKSELEAAERRLTSSAEALAETTSRIEGLEREDGEKAAVADQFDAAREALATAGADLEAFDRLQRLQNDLNEIDSEMARSQVEEARHHLEAAVRVNAPGLLAGSLVSGEPCPVCGSVHHPEPSSSEDVSELTKAFETFGAAAAARERLAERRRGLVDKMIEEREPRGWTSSTPERSELEQRYRAAEEHKGATERARQRRQEIDDLLTAARRARDEKHAEGTKATEAVGAHQGRVQSLEGQITTTLKALPEEYRDPVAFDANLATSRERVQVLTRRLTDAARAAQTAELDDANATTVLRGLQGQLKTAEETLERVRAEFHAKLAKAGFRDRAEFEAAELEPEELDDQRAKLDEYRTAVADTNANIALLTTKLEGKEHPDLAALEAALTAASAQVTETEERASEVTERRNTIKTKRDEFRDLEKRDSELADRRSAAIKLDHLANGQLAGKVKVKLETFVLQSIFHEVLEEGNRHLRHMTGGRYTLLLREAAGATASGLELDVRDNAAGGATRPVATLSGGEGFLASLALALGLSEVAQRRSGGTELGALFIDEGFGSLDAHALDQVVGILRGLQDGHRMVGVISHVEELKRRIPAQLHVVTGPAGSSVQMRLND